MLAAQWSSRSPARLPLRGQRRHCIHFLNAHRLPVSPLERVCARGTPKTVPTLRRQFEPCKALSRSGCGGVARNVMAHSHRVDLLPTLKTNKHRCPFSGACKIQAKDKYPVECDERPWNRFLSARRGDEVCWYAAGVKSLASFPPRAPSTSGDAQRSQTDSFKAG
jgi:hypothetical protein